MTINKLNQNASLYKYLKKHIPVAAILGGVFIGFLSVFSDLIGTIGSGTGMLLVVNIIYNYYD